MVDNNFFSAHSLTALPIAASSFGMEQKKDALRMAAFTVLRGHNLMASDVGGTSDPYVIVKVSHQIWLYSGFLQWFHHFRWTGKPSRPALP